MEVMLKGDVEQLLAYMQEHATPQFRDGTMAEDMRAAVAMLGNPVNAYTFDAVMPGPGGAFMIRLAPPDGAQPLAFSIETSGGAPHGINRIRPVPIRRGPPPSP